MDLYAKEVLALLVRYHGHLLVEKGPVNEKGVPQPIISVRLADGSLLRIPTDHGAFEVTVPKIVFDDLRKHKIISAEGRDPIFRLTDEGLAYARQSLDTLKNEIRTGSY